MKPQRKPLQHAFSMPIVQETRRPAEPAWLTSVW